MSWSPQTEASLRATFKLAMPMVMLAASPMRTRRFTLVNGTTTRDRDQASFSLLTAIIILVLGTKISSMAMVLNNGKTVQVTMVRSFMASNKARALSSGLMDPATADCLLTT